MEETAVIADIIQVAAAVVTVLTVVSVEAVVVTVAFLLVRAAEAMVLTTMDAVVIAVTITPQMSQVNPVSLFLHGLPKKHNPN